MFNLYDNIYELCAMRGVTPGKMCDDLGVSKSVLSNLKNGRSNSLTNKSAKRFADYLEVSVDELMHGIKTEEIKKDAADNGSVDEVIDLLTDLRDNPDMRMLLHSAKGATADQIRAVAQMLESFKNGK